MAEGRCTGWLPMSTANLASDHDCVLPKDSSRRSTLWRFAFSHISFPWAWGKAKRSADGSTALQIVELALWNVISSVQLPNRVIWLRLNLLSSQGFDATFEVEA